MNQKLKGFGIGVGIGTALCGAFAYAHRDRFVRPAQHPVALRIIMNCENTTNRYGELMMREPGPDTLHFYFRREADPTSSIREKVEARPPVTGEMTPADAAQIVAPFCNEEDEQPSTLVFSDRELD